MKRRLKYFLIVLLNAIILTTLLAIWTGRISSVFYPFIRAIEFLKIIGISFASLGGIKLLSLVLKRLASDKLIQKKFFFSVILVLLFSSFMYFPYIKKATFVWLNPDYQKLLTKIEFTEHCPYCIQADSLTNSEYCLISETTWMPELSAYAANISFQYQYEGFLPDYYLEITYTLPKSEEIASFEFEEEQFSNYQLVELKDDGKLVTYVEDRK